MISSTLRNIPNLSMMSQMASRGFKKTVENLPHDVIANKPVFVRVDFNVPLSKTETQVVDGVTYGVITDDTRIREALPTIEFLRKQNAKVILASHCGRPKGEVIDKLRMKPMALKLGELINNPVQVVSDCKGEEVRKAVEKLNGGDVLMLENLRFYKQEEKNDATFCSDLASSCGATVYVNDAFGTAHRAHASTVGITSHMSHNVAGFLMEKELKFLKGVVDAPKRPFVAILGGSKVSSKINVIRSLLNKCDKVLIGGGMTFTFLAAQGKSVGSSLVETDCIDTARELLALAQENNVRLLLPTDILVAKELSSPTADATVSADAMPEGLMGLDIGPETVQKYIEEIQDAHTVVWNGPMGVFEQEAFSHGTTDLAKALAAWTNNDNVSVVGGGDSVAALRKAGVTDQISHVSTGGGASLEMLEGLELPGVAALDDA